MLQNLTKFYTKNTQPAIYYTIKRTPDILKLQKLQNIQLFYINSFFEKI